MTPRDDARRDPQPPDATSRAFTPVFAGYGATSDTLAPVMYATR
jgi:hypothetical protein